MMADVSFEGNILGPREEEIWVYSQLIAYTAGGAKDCTGVASLAYDALAFAPLRQRAKRCVAATGETMRCGNGRNDALRQRRRGYSFPTQPMVSSM